MLGDKRRDTWVERTKKHMFQQNQIVKSKSFGVWKFDDKFPVDIRGTSDEPFFNGKDVCEMLGFKDP